MFLEVGSCDTNSNVNSRKRAVTVLLFMILFMILESLGCGGKRL